MAIFYQRWRLLVKVNGQQNIYTTTSTSYIKGNDKITVVQREDQKEVRDEFEVGNNFIKCAYSYWLGDNHLLKAITSRITTTEYNDKDCYKIETNDTTLWIDKDTGLVCRRLNGFGVAEFSYEFDIVKDDDIVKPNVL